MKVNQMNNHEANIARFLDAFNEDSTSNELSDGTMVKLLAFCLGWCTTKHLEDALIMMDEDGLLEDEHLLSILEMLQDELDRRNKVHCMEEMDDHDDGPENDDVFDFEIDYTPF